MDGLTVGRMVHFVVKDDVHRAAIIVNVLDANKGICDLFVFTAPKDERPNFTYAGAWYAEGKYNSTWHWMEPA